MAKKSKQGNLVSLVQKHYPAGTVLDLGAGVLNDETLAEARIRIPLKTLNRHGLIAGATGTGKTKSLQVIAEGLSSAGVPVLLMDLKGDLSGLGAPGKSNKAIEERHASIDIPFEPGAFPVEFLSLTGKQGAPLRATITEFGPILLSRILNLNDTQSGILSVIFKFCDDQGLLLLDLKDLKKTIQFVKDEGSAELEHDYGKLSSASLGTILRKVIALEEQGADKFFGEPSFEIDDLLVTDDDGRGRISIVNLTDIQDRPHLFSTFMLGLLSEIYEELEEQGDADRPRLTVFIDEAHLLFKKATPALIEKIEAVVKLIRSKGVGLFFCTQNPDDLPPAVLSQLGLKVQHALRAFTARDRKAIKKSAENFPVSDFYEIDELLTSLGIGEALITGLDAKGRPTPVVHTMLRAPASRMGPLKAAERKAVLENSELVEHYKQSVDRKSAYEMLGEKIESIAEAQEEAAAKKKKKKKKSSRRRSAKEDESTFSKIMGHTLTKQIGRTVAREVTRGVLGAFGLRTTRRRRTRKRRRRKSSGWF